MSSSIYTLEDLQILDDLALTEAKTMGLEPPETLFHLAQAEEIYDIAARGLPGRYSHWRFGRSYEEQKGAYDKGKGRIYELVINTRPVHAYLLDGNSLVAQMLTIAHVYGHSTVFEHNAYFEPADKNILSRVRSATERIDSYIGEFGRSAVEDFIDACESLQYHSSFDQLGDRFHARAPEWKTDPLDVLFPDEAKERREKFEKERDEFKRRFPKEPERDILAFVEEHSRYLDPWQRDIISIIRSERSYFVPQMKTQVLNEGVAVTWHNTILQRIMMARPDMFNTDDFFEFQAMNSGVLHPKIHTEPNPENPEELLVHSDDINPYLLGSIIFEDIERVCKNPDDDDKEKFDWAGKADPIEMRAEIIRAYDDSALITDFLTPRICERAKLYMRPRTVQEYKNIVVSEEECEEVRKILVKGKRDFGIPVVEIVDADHELWLEHRHEGIGLDDEYANVTGHNLSTLWGRPIVIKTLKPGSTPENQKDIWIRIHPSGMASHFEVAPKKE